MIGPALLASALASAIVAWGVPASFSRPSQPSHLASLFEPDTALAPDADAAGGGNPTKDVVQLVIRRHIDEVQRCYEQQRSRLPDLAGRIEVQFTIAASGKVVASTLARSTMGNARVETCTVAAVRRWQFPKPLDGGIMVITYPFILTPEPPKTDGGVSATRAE